MKISKIIVALFLVIILSNFAIAREYDPTVGRFIQRDPIEYVGGINIYTYVENNPVNKVDPFGLLSKTQTDEDPCPYEQIRWWAANDYKSQEDCEEKRFKQAYPLPESFEKKFTETIDLAAFILSLTKNKSLTKFAGWLGALNFSIDVYKQMSKLVAKAQCATWITEQWGPKVPAKEKELKLKIPRIFLGHFDETSGKCDDVILTFPGGVDVCPDLGAEDDCGKRKVK